MFGWLVVHYFACLFVVFFARFGSFFCILLLLLLCFLVLALAFVVLVFVLLNEDENILNSTFSHLIYVPNHSFLSRFLFASLSSHCTARSNATLPRLMTRVCDNSYLDAMFQCIPSNQRCDYVDHCINGVDEHRCEKQYRKRRKFDLYGRWKIPFPTVFPPVLINFVDAGINISKLPGNGTSLISRPCPDTHFQCPGDQLCLPVYVRCNNVYDCPGHEDEAECWRYSVSGFYRCRASQTHLHPSQVCDGRFQCPQRDDELFCSLICPLNCTCYGSAFFCDSSFSMQDYVELRFAEGRGSGLKPTDFANNIMLIHLGLASCGLTHLSLPTLHNLRSLDVSDNHLQALKRGDLKTVEQLHALSLSGNPVSLQSLASLQPLLSLNVLDLSKLHLPVLNVSISATFPNVQSINLSHSGIERVSLTVFQTLSNLRVLDLSGCPVNHFPHDVFSRLQYLEVVYSDNYKLCCPAILPRGFNLKNCHAPSDEVSSCDALLRSNMYRIFLAFFAASSLLGNLLSFVYRVLSSSSSKSAFGVFVTHLCVSDFLMGVYLAIIGIADALYRGSYLWQDEQWKHSVVCQTAGVTSLLSCEVSAFIICLITLDRFLVLRFPFSQCHFSHRSALVVCGVVWCGGLMLAVVPLMPGLSHWQYYSQSGICIPLPITRKTFDGHKYSFSIMIVFNFVLFLIVALGQLIIYWSIRTNSMSASTAVANRKSKDLTIARRLFAVATSDFLCWFPVGLLGLLTSQGVAVPGEINVAMAIIVLPLNSVLNPFLYTLNVIQERRRKAKELRLQKRLMQQGRQQSGCETSGRVVVDKLKLSYTKQEVCLLLERWLHDNLLSKEQLNDLV